VNENILQLDVSVHDAFGVQFSKRKENLNENRLLVSISDESAMFIDPLFKCTLVTVFHDDPLVLRITAYFFDEPDNERAVKLFHHSYFAG